MVGISKLYLGRVEASDPLRYKRHSSRLPSHLLQFSQDKRPVVVWNCTRACNLNCAHCYASSGCQGPAEDELSTQEARSMLADLAAFKVPVVLFSGGEPLVRRDLPDLASHAVALGMRAVISTNGTLIDDATAATLRDIGLSYVGVSLDGMEATHDRFRRRAGAFQEALRGIRACRDAGVKVGLRFTMTQYNRQDIPGIFDLVEQEDIPRVCFYHVVPAGAAADQQDAAIPAPQTRETMDLIMRRTTQLADGGHPAEILTVTNHADGPYVVLTLLREGRTAQARNALELLKMNGGNSSGHGIGCISWDGTVYPDQFWRNKPVGNVRTRSFSDIWGQPDNPLLQRLRQRPRPVRGRCESCRFLEVCNGNLRARAEALTGDPWACDPACYLTDAEIAPTKDGDPLA